MELESINWYIISKLDDSEYYLLEMEKFGQKVVLLRF